jgi:hypothetical protein
MGTRDALRAAAEGLGEAQVKEWYKVIPIN